MKPITLRDMFAAGVHFGHRSRFWNPKMAPYIYGVRDKLHIINLDKTLPMYQEAVHFAMSVVAKNGKVLFVGTKRAAHEIIREEAQRCGMPFVDHRWLGGMLTNYKTIRQSIKRLKDMQAMVDLGQLDKLTKKEALGVHREIIKLERALGGIKDMGGLPDAIFVIDIGHEHIAVQEANKMKIPVIGIADTNADPDPITYVIPGNDDARRAIKLYAGHLADAIIKAQEGAKPQAATSPTDEYVEVEEPAPTPTRVIKKPAAGRRNIVIPGADDSDDTDD